ncbi:protein translocase subunit SecD [Olsenella massiliensis]|uniref:protein translocase subunit SecD n=1 Tax=Olsenella massiliensis TaxID=1622075 RepID=UPI00071D1239|nr:protein translocase subunit SecD [Olsenella massiliensis]
MSKQDAGPGRSLGLSRWTGAGATPPPKGARGRRPATSSTGRRADLRLRRSIRRYVSTLVILLVVLVVAVVGFTPLRERITQGLDIQGGVSVIMRATKPDGSAPTSGDMATAAGIVQNRVNALGASETSVQQQGSNSILIQIPGATNADQVISTLGQTGHLEFARLDQIGDADALLKLNAGATNVRLKEGTYTSFMDGSDISTVSVAQDPTKASGGYAVNLRLGGDGSAKFAAVTKELAPIKGRIAIVLDGVVYSAPAVQSEITTGQVSITGGFSLDEAQQLKTVLDSGSLPVTLTYSESRVVGPTLGQDSLGQGVVAIAIGAAVVVAYLFVFYQGLGLLTMGSLVVFAVLYLGLLALLSHVGAYALTLPGLAAVVLTTGSAADSSILVLERFREEIRMGRSIRQASISGARHGIMTSLDADAVSLVTALALFFVAVGSVKGFGLTLALGIVCDIVTMFCFKAPALRLLALRAIERHPGFWGVRQDLAAAAPGEGRKGGEAHA